jgi:tRNA 2-thiocytidine biosynthesis protein TtcA
MRTTIRLLEQKILHRAGAALDGYGMIGEGDHVLAALSGGKDSYALLHVLTLLRRRSPVPWRLSAVAVDPGDPSFPAEAIRAAAAAYGCDCVVERTTIFADVPRTVRRARDFCSLCSRFRRGALLRVARREGANRLALGHHRGDLLETLLMNLCFTGRFRGMAPVLPSAGGAVTVIRPLITTPERLVAELAGALAVPLHSCSRGESTRRQWARELLVQLEAANPAVRESLFSALDL